jgi:hypothetical protein
MMQAMLPRPLLEGPGNIPHSFDQMPRVLKDSSPRRQPALRNFYAAKVRSIAALTLPIGAMPSTVRRTPFFP